MIRVTGSISLNENDFIERQVKASGPGGQAVNKTSSAIELRFSVNDSNLSDYVKGRLADLAGSRMSGEGVIVIFAQEFRSLEMNRQAARERLVELVKQAAFRPKIRRPTKPTKASKIKRVEGKVRRGSIKSARAKPGFDD
jgi:ribosome-associated protein